MTENILYYGKARTTAESGGPLVAFIMRGVVSPFAHPFFTSMTGIGLGLARQPPTGVAREISRAPPLIFAWPWRCIAFGTSAPHWARFFPDISRLDGPGLPRPDHADRVLAAQRRSDHPRTSR